MSHTWHISHYDVLVIQHMRHTWHISHYDALIIQHMSHTWHTSHYDVLVIPNIWVIHGILVVMMYWLSMGQHMSHTWHIGHYDVLVIHGRTIPNRHHSSGQGHEKKIVRKKKRLRPIIYWSVVSLLPQNLYGHERLLPRRQKKKNVGVACRRGCRRVFVSVVCVSECGCFVSARWRRHF